MHRSLLEILRCPVTGQRLIIDEEVLADERIASGWLVSKDERHRYEIRNFVPRFVPPSNYADNFGAQWHRFPTTQLDTHSGHPISANRFWSTTGWSSTALRDCWVLDAGCGAGRFAEVALQAGAIVVALDYSGAVDACYANLSHYPNLHVVQGDLYALPFASNCFAFVYSLGVLQHTPDVQRAFAALPRMLRDGGRLCVDFYRKSWRSALTPKYWLRPLTTRIPQSRLFELLEMVVPPLLRVSQLIGRVPAVGSTIKLLVPVADYSEMLPLDAKAQAEWALLDTFDWLAPRYDHPQRAATIQHWLEAARLAEVEVLQPGHLTGRGVKRLASGVASATQ